MFPSMTVAATAKPELAYKRKARKRGKNRKIRIEQVYDLDNLWQAEGEARKNKKNHKGVRIFNENPVENINWLSQAIRTRTFHSTEPVICSQMCPCGKERILTKVPHFPDHIEHHGMMRVLMPFLIRYYYQESAASIKGRGMHYAARRTARWIDEHKSYGRIYYIKRDFVKFYHNIRQDKIYDHLCKLFGNEGIRYLIKEAVTVCEDGLGIGLFPIQPFANSYTSPLCRIIMRRFKVHIEIYCDDIVILGTDKKEVWKASRFIDEYAEKVMMQPLHENVGMQIIDERHFLDFVGYRFYFNHTLLRKKMKIKFRRAMARIKDPVRRYQVAMSYKGWLMHCDGFNLWRSVMHAKTYRIPVPDQYRELCRKWQQNNINQLKQVA